MAAFLDLVNHSASVRDTTVYCFVTRVTAMSEPRLGMKVIRALSREMALGHILRKVSRLLREKAAAQIELRRCDHFGPGAQSRRPGSRREPWEYRDRQRLPCGRFLLRRGACQ